MVEELVQVHIEVVPDNKLVRGMVEAQEQGMVVELVEEQVHRLVGKQHDRQVPELVLGTVVEPVLDSIALEFVELEPVQELGKVGVQVHIHVRELEQDKVEVVALAQELGKVVVQVQDMELVE